MIWFIAAIFLSCLRPNEAKSAFVVTPRHSGIHQQTSCKGKCFQHNRLTLPKLSAEASSSTNTITPPTPLPKPGTAELDVPWSELGFEFRPTKSYLRMVFKDGKWGPSELVQDQYINLHIGATALHYGQACFEGLKAFAHADGSVQIFRPDENAKRMQTSCERTMMASPSVDEFVQAVRDVVRDNIEYVPPYGSGGSLYIRPLLFGSGARIGLQPSDEYTFLVMVIPVGDYYRGGLSKPVDGLVVANYDRAAPRGVGHVKVAGNYAADLLPNSLGKKEGYPIGLYLDAKTQSLVEEFSTSNFVGIHSGKKAYVTPSSGSVLKSITNKSLMTIAAEQEGWTVETRDIPLSELESFDEVFACGTAVVLTPVGSITMPPTPSSPEAKAYSFGQAGEIGEMTQKLYDIVRKIQLGEMEDKYGWNFPV